MLVKVCLFVLILGVPVLASAEGIAILAPTDGANVVQSDIIIIGKVGKDVKEVELKGVSKEPLKVKATKGGFFAKVKLSAKQNKIVLSADDGSAAELNVTVGNSKTFNYHPDIDEVSDCSSTCHTDTNKNGYAVEVAADVCFECHDRNDQKAYVHGPINMGICGVCHMPHGSSNSFFLMAEKKVICSGCHDALTSTHPDTSSKICVDCHDPHSSDKKFHIK